MGRFQFVAFSAFSRKLQLEITTETVVDRLKTNELKSVASAFVGNVNRVGCLGMLLGSIADAVQIGQVVADRALFELTGGLSRKAKNPPTNEQFATKRHELSLELASQTARLRSASLITGDETEPHTAQAMNIDYLADQMVGSESEALHTGLSALYGALLIGAYTALESLATDLWVAAVNLRPKSLAMNVITTPSRKGNDGSGESSAQRAMMPLADLSDYDFDLRTHMGDLLKQRERVAFESLKSTENAYLATFRELASKNKGGSQESKRLKELFQTASDTGALESIRNLLAHRGGVVDTKFLAQAQRYSPELRNATKGSLLHVDGEMVAKYADAAVKLSSSLLGFVDEWLSTHPE